MAAVAAVTFGTLGASAGSDETQAAQQKRGGTISRSRGIEDSQSFDKTNVFQNESIWLVEQINEPLYTVAPDGKTSEAVARDELHGLEGQEDVHLQAAPGRQVLERQGDDGGRREVLDRRRARPEPGLGLPRRRDQEHQAPNKSTVVFNLKYPWAPFLADIALFANGIIPKNFAGKTRAEFYKHPIGTGPFMWDNASSGSRSRFKRNPDYWQKGKPYLDSVTWTYVTDENTRELQLRGGRSRSTSSRPSTRSRSSRPRPA